MLVEIAVVPDTFVSGLAHIEDIGGGCLRFVCFVCQDGDRIVAARIVMPADALPDAIKKALAASAGHYAGQVAGLLPKLLN
ncbi:MAG: hypothetical protein AB7I42_25090 [Bradyrhizobium sp.]|uniref:hypothetical protein n=1 Tax=Bradyrhizobium sp. TaxID=376 RepID=UPI003D140B20